MDNAGLISKVFHNGLVKRIAFKADYFVSECEPLRLIAFFAADAAQRLTHWKKPARFPWPEHL